ncbi:MAG TPA: MrpF/PhaF family protein [Conexibacter sp.]|nr:MrpF/PhaF family protein [Conexibacter sp.]
MNGWLWAATILAGALIPLIVVAALRPAAHGLVALELAGLDAALTMLLFAEGTRSQSFATLALVLAVMSFAGSIGFIRFLAMLETPHGGDDG